MKLKQNKALFFGRKGAENKELVRKVESYNLRAIVTDSLADFAAELIENETIMIIIENDQIEKKNVDVAFFYQIIKLSKTSIYLIIGQKPKLNNQDEIFLHFDEVIPKKISTEAKLNILDTYCKAVQLIFNQQNQHKALNDNLEVNDYNEKQKRELQKRDRLISTLYLQIIMYKKLMRKNYIAWRALELSLDDKKIRDFHNNMRRTLPSSNVEWEQFYEHFVYVHPHFFKSLVKLSKDLTHENLKVCAYIKMGLSNNDIASHFNILKSSVKRAQTRIKKKLNLQPNITLRKFILELEIPS